MNNKQLIATLADRMQITHKEAGYLLQTYVEELIAQFRTDTQVNFVGIGTFEVKAKAQRIMQNPGTGQRMLVPPKLSLNFTPSATIKKQIKKLEP